MRASRALLPARVLAVVSLALALPVDGARADVAAPAPLAASGIEARVGSEVPRALPFRSSDGRQGDLGALLGEGRPVLLALGYYRCPMLCPLVLRGAADAMRGAHARLGRDFAALSLSVDPGEDLAAAAARRHELGADDARSPLHDWRFGVAPPAAVRELAQAVGFRYARDATSGQYAHPAAIVVLTPDGRVSGYLPAVGLAPAELDAAVAAAAHGVPGPSLVGAIAQCFRFHPALRRHAAAIANGLRVSGVLILLGALAAVVLGIRRVGERA